MSLSVLKILCYASSFCIKNYYRVMKYTPVDYLHCFDAFFLLLKFNVCRYRDETDILSGLTILHILFL